jgi:hypothetical protein
MDFSDETKNYKMGNSYSRRMLVYGGYMVSISVELLCSTGIDSFFAED